eukprot:792824-Prymnesium_polylepis.2
MSGSRGPEGSGSLRPASSLVRPIDDEKLKRPYPNGKVWVDNVVAGIRLQGSQGAIFLRPCLVTNKFEGDIGVEAGNVTVFSCTIHDCKNHGVLYVGSGRGERCVVEKFKLNGLLLRDGAAPTLSDNLLKGNGQSERR